MGETKKLIGVAAYKRAEMILTLIFSGVTYSLRFLQRVGHPGLVPRPSLCRAFFRHLHFPPWLRIRGAPSAPPVRRFLSVGPTFNFMSHKMGGFKVPNSAEIHDSYAFDKVIQKDCF